MANATESISIGTSSERKRLLAAPLTAVAFWSAIALPLAYLPFLMTGIESTRGLFAFLVLFALHAAALFVGRSHRRAS